MSRLKGFFTRRIPQLVLSLQKLFWAALGIFVASAAFGYFLTTLNPFAANAIVGDEYVYMTLENIENHQPLAVYEQGLRYQMSSFIMANNIHVAFMAFAFGALYGIGTCWILIQNGLMLGSITAVFAQHGLLLGFLSTVLIHGTLELFAIIVAAAAGLRLGQSLFRPGMLTRMEALYRFGNEAFQICAAMIPVFVVAAVLEGFVTPLHIRPLERVFFIAASLTGLGLYLVYPTITHLRRLKAVPATASPNIVARF